MDTSNAYSDHLGNFPLREQFLAHGSPGHLLRTSSTVRGHQRVLHPRYLALLPRDLVSPVPLHSTGTADPLLVISGRTLEEIDLMYALLPNLTGPRAHTILQLLQGIQREALVRDGVDYDAENDGRGDRGRRKRGAQGHHGRAGARSVLEYERQHRRIVRWRPPFGLRRRSSCSQLE